MARCALAAQKAGQPSGRAQAPAATPRPRSAHPAPCTPSEDLLLRGALLLGVPDELHFGAACFWLSAVLHPIGARPIAWQIAARAP